MTMTTMSSSCASASVLWWRNGSVIYPHFPIRRPSNFIHCCWRTKIRRRRAAISIRCNSSRRSIDMYSGDDFEVQRLLGTYGYMNITSYTAPPPSLGSNIDQAAAGLDEAAVQRRISGQEVGEGGVQTRLYAGRIARGPRTGTRVILKAYPGRSIAGIEADAMAANELATHAILQETSEDEMCPNVAQLFGGFQTLTGEQWLVFRDDGQFTAADYAKAASIATTEGRAVGDWEFLDLFDFNRPINRRYTFIIKLLRGVFGGLAHMHSRGRLHQSLGPASVVINTLAENDVYFLVPRLRDMAFSVDISDEAIFQVLRNGLNSKNRNIGGELDEYSVGSSVASSWAEILWRRARVAGAITPFEQKAFGIADDIYAGGLLMAYMIFIPLCKSGSIDGPSLQRLLETSFRLDLEAAREYCLADDRWVEAVKFLDIGDRSGWELLQAILNPDYRQRPIAEAILNHRFMTGAVL